MDSEILAVLSSLIDILVSVGTFLWSRFSSLILKARNENESNEGPMIVIVAEEFERFAKSERQNLIYSLVGTTTLLS